MADYVRALKNYRKQLAQTPTRVEEEQVAPTNGLMSNTRRQQASQSTQPQENAYEPGQAVKSGLSAIISAREAFSKQVQDQAMKLEESSLTSFANAALENSSKPTKAKEADKLKESSGLMSRTDGKRPASKTSLSYGDAKATAAKAVLEDTEFLTGVKSLATKHGLAPEELLSIMHFETGGSFSPSQRNAAGSSATGLIQFLSSTAKGLGTSTDELAGMTRMDQLKYVDKYFEQSPLGRGGSTGGSDAYMAVFYPAAVGKPDDHVLFSQGSKAYEQNRGLDSEGKGYITKADAARKALRYASAYRGV